VKRPHIPMQVKLDAALLQLGLDPKHVRLDHHPPLSQRRYRHYKPLDLPWQTIYDPDANDPRYLQWLSTEAHAEKTTGRRGTSKLSKRGGDISEIAKTKRLEKKQSEFRQMLLTKGEVSPVIKPKKPKRKIPSRPMRSAGKTKFPTARRRPHG
jgi:hypothetical protein